MKSNFIHLYTQKTIHLIAKIFEPVIELIKKILPYSISYHSLLAIFSYITLSCGIFNLIGNEPHTMQLIIVGSVGLFLSVAEILFKFFRIGLLILSISLQK